MTSGKSKYRDTLRVLMTLSTVGIEIGVAVGIGFGVGHYLDGRWGTKPWLTILLGLCGLIAAGRALYRLVRRLQRFQQELEKGQDDRPA